MEMKFTSSWIPEPQKVIFMSTSTQSHLSLLSPWISDGFLCRWNDCILPYISWRMWFWHGTRDFFHSDKSASASYIQSVGTRVWNLLNIGPWFIDNRILTPDRPFKRESPRVGPGKSESTNWTQCDASELSVRGAAVGPVPAVVIRLHPLKPKPDDISWLPAATESWQ